MKLVKNSFEIIETDLKPSEVSIIPKLINNIKFPEYVTIYLKISDKDSFKGDYVNNKHSVSVFKWNGPFKSQYKVFYITTTLKELLDNDWLDDLKYICEPTDYHEKRICIKFNVSKGLVSEFTKYKQFDFRIEQQYKDLSFIIPDWLDIPEDDYEIEEEEKYEGIEDIICYAASDEKWDTQDLKVVAFLKACDDAEYNYYTLINQGLNYYQAKELLPDNIKIELTMVGYISDWKFFFECNNSQIQKLIKPLKEYYGNN